MKNQRISGGEPARSPIVNLLNKDIFDKYLRFLAFLIKSTVSNLFGVDLRLVRVNFLSKIDNLIAAWIKYVKSPLDPFDEFNFSPNMDSVYRLTLVSFITKLINLRPYEFDSVVATLLNCSVNELASILYALISRELNNDEIKSVIKNAVKFNVYSSYSKLLNDKVSIALFSSIKNQVEVNDSCYESDKCLTLDVVKIQSDIRDKIYKIRSSCSYEVNLEDKINKVINDVYDYYGVKSVYFHKLGAFGRAKFCSSKLVKIDDYSKRHLSNFDHMCNLKSLLDHSAENISSQIISRFESIDYKSILNKYSDLNDYLEWNYVSLNYGLVKSMIINGGIYIPSPLIDLEFPFDPSRLSDYIKFVPYNKNAVNTSRKFIEIIKNLNEYDKNEFCRFIDKFFISSAHQVFKDDYDDFDFEWVGKFVIGVKL